MAINKNFIVDAGLEVKAGATVNTSLTAGSLTVNGAASVAGAMTVAGNVNTATINATALNVGSNVVLTNARLSIGNSSVNSYMTSTGIYTGGGIIASSGATLGATIADSVRVNNTFDARGAIVANSTLSVAGNTVLSGTANVSGNVVITGTANVSGNATFTSAVVIQGNLTVSGTTTTVNTQTLNVADNLITLNSDWTGAPTENAGMEVNRGSSANVALIWNETSDRWEITNDGSNYGLVHSTLRDVVLGTETSGAYIANATSTTPALTLAGTGGEGAVLTGSIRTASTSQDGIVTLTDSISNTSAGVAGSASAVKKAYDDAVTFASNASNIGNGTLAAARLATSGVVAGQYGSSSTIPVITVDDKGRVTAVSNTSVAGVTGYTYTGGANNTFTITTGTGATFSANLNSLVGTFGIDITGTAANSAALNGQNASYYTDIVSRLGYTPVQQGGGTGQLTNKVYIGWNGSQLNLQVDNANFGATWPIGISGTAATATLATTATTANALNTGNSYQGVNFTATGRFLAANGSAGSPSIAFTSDGATDTGFYWTTDGYINMTNNGVYGGQFGPGGTLTTVGAITASQFNGSGAGLTGTASSLTAGAANAVAWTNVSGRPTAVSAFTNDSGYITATGRSYPRNTTNGGDLNFYVSAQGGQNTYVWGTGDGVNMYLYNPSNFSVSYAASAGSAGAVNGNIQGTLAGNLTWSSGVNILVGGESSFDLSSGGSWSVYDSTRTAAFINCAQSDAHVRMVQNGGNVYVYGSRLYNDSGQQAVFNNGGTWGINISGSAGSALTASQANQVVINYNNDSNSTYQMLWGSVNSVFGTGGIYCNPASDIIYASDFYVTSDDRLKNRIGNVQSALAAVNSLNGFKFTWNEKATELRNYTDDTIQVGVSAQEVEAILPEAVHTDADGYKTVSYDSLVPLLIEAVKELTEKVARLEAR